MGIIGKSKTVAFWIALKEFIALINNVLGKEKSRQLRKVCFPECEIQEICPSIRVGVSSALLLHPSFPVTDKIILREICWGLKVDAEA